MTRGDQRSDDRFGRWLRTRRGLLGLSQRDLARAAGISQPVVAAVETGRRPAGDRLRAKLTDAVAMYPSYALELCADDVVRLFARYGQPSPSVFGSIARGTDTPDSDVDLMCAFTGDLDLFDLTALRRDLAELLTFDVDLVNATNPVSSRVLERARRESVPVAA